MMNRIVSNFSDLSIISLILTFVFMALGCQEDNTGYQLSGTIENAAHQKLFLEEWQPRWISKNRTVIDTARTDGQGNFQMSGYLKNRGIYRLRVGPNRNRLNYQVYPPMEMGRGKSTLLLLDNKTIHFRAAVNQLDRYVIEGTRGARAIQKMVARMSQSQQQLQKLQRSFQQKAKRTQNRDSLSRVMNQQLKQIGQRNRKYYRQIVDTTTDLVIKLFAALHLDPREEKDLKILNNVASGLQNSHPDNKFAQKVAQKTQKFLKAKQRKKKKAARLAKGKKAPEIRLPNLNGDTIPLSSLRGKVVLVDFWASWCKPCRKMNPRLVKTYKKFKDQSFTIYSVSLDGMRQQSAPKRSWKRAIQQDNLMWKYHVSDLKGWDSRAAQKYNISSIPRSFLLNRKGEIVAKNLHGQKLDQKIKQLLN